VAVTVKALVPTVEVLMACPFGTGPLQGLVLSAVVVTVIVAASALPASAGDAEQHNGSG
jgi:hypothetical protein